LTTELRSFRLLASAAHLAPAATRGIELMRRLTRRAFTVLAIFMMGFGLLMGIVFPPFVVLLGMPAENAFSPLFMGACIAAGLCVGAMNWILARVVVGRRFQVLTDRMNDVSLEVDKLSQADALWHSDPARWRIPVDSEDVLGRTAAAFNRLAEVLARSLRYQNAGRSFAEILVGASSLEGLANAALDCLIMEAGADSGAIVTKDESGLHVPALRGIASPDLVLNCRSLVRALESGAPDAEIGLCDLEVAGANGRVAEVLAMPFMFGGEVRGAMVLASTTPLTAYARLVTDLFAGDFGVAVAGFAANEREPGDRGTGS
jgi:two-component system, cell cycle response regulator